MEALVVEDDQAVARVISVVLEREGYDVIACGSGAGALEAVRDRDVALIVLDIRLPPPDGLEVCRRLRAAGDQTPILILTSRGSVNDRIAGLEAGADDYLPKPFDLGELTARIRAVVRRGAHQPASEVVEVGDLRLDVSSRTVCRGGLEIDLSTREFDLLHVFTRRPGHVLSRNYLLESVWGYTHDVSERIVDVYVSYLRAKIDEPFGTRTIETVRGAGYRLRREQS